MYLIRQNPEDHNSYCLTVRIEHELKNFKINHYEDDHVGMDQQPKFKSLRSFVEYYRKRENSWCLEGQLKKAVPIEPKDKSLRLLDNSALNEELPPQPDMALRVPWIPEDSLSLQSEWRHLGDGDFTRVYAADLKKRVDQRTCRQRVAVKRPKQDASSIIQEKFSKSVDRMSSWVHSHIIKFEGIGAGYMMVMEYASQGPLDRYLRALTEHGGSGMTLTEQLHAATQLIRALEYLV
ncbi:tyrosine-protein kinase JAK2-like [Diadema antillarum]|uniref:tyrosine-protein kinase JAK2-like n=1 Tax=Diadema antillarum TaxID=105358 RepID=UPI003A885BEA